MERRMRTVFVIGVFLFAAIPVLGNKKYFHGSAIEFLTQYGHYYGLFGRFFPNTTYSLPPESKTTGLGTNHLWRNYNTYNTWGARADRVLYPPQPQLYHPKCKPELFSNDEKFRFGPRPHDRFFSIFFRKDPWVNSDAAINFVGYSTDIPATVRLFCKFTYPGTAVTEVNVVSGIKDVLERDTNENILSCPIPVEVYSQLSEEVTEVSLDFIVMNSSLPDSIPVNETVIFNIQVPREHISDRRAFNVSACTMLDNLNDDMVVEWLVYNILLGVEHFYLFDNSREKIDLWTSKLHPFLGANIVTLIYYPWQWFGDETYGIVQRSSFQVTLQRFGHLNQYIGFYDIDEFFLPSPNYIPSPAVSLSNSNDSSVEEDWWIDGEGLVESVLSMICGHSDVIPGAMFETLEMGCQDEGNYYKSPQASRPAVTTTCTKKGFQFKEMQHGHGKMYVKPALVTFMSSPHRLNMFEVIWTTPVKGGRFMHFNRFKYSPREVVAQGVVEDTLRLFTLQALRTIGVTPTSMQRRKR